MKNWKLKREHGFTLIELLMAVAIIVVLVGVGMYLSMNFRAETRQNELDAKAETIFMAAQNRLTELQASGRTDVYDNSGSSYRPADSDRDLTLCCVRNDENLLPEDSVEAEIRDNYWIIEYEPGTAGVYSVFYSEKALPEDNQLDDSRFRERRLDNGATVGYYGGGGEELAGNTESVTLDDNALEIVNGETLEAKVTLPSGKYDSYEVTVTGDSSGAKKTYNNEASITLDGYSNGSDHFYKLNVEIEGNKFQPGENLTVELHVKGDFNYINNDIKKSCNSLFADTTDTEGGTAYITCRRHLQNLNKRSAILDPNTSDEWDKFKYAVQGDKLDLNNEKFTSIYNNNLESYDGQGYEIEELKIDNDTNPKAGLFETVSSNMTVSNLTLSNPVITGKDSGNAGAVAGILEGKLYNVTVTGAKVSAENGNVGGIAGVVETQAELSNVAVSVNEIQAENANAGGVIGRTSGKVTLNGVTVSGENEATVTGGNAGGLLGEVASGGTLILQNTIQLNNPTVKATKNAGGVVGLLSGGYTQQSPSVTVTGIKVQDAQNAGGVIGQADVAVTLNSVTLDGTSSVTGSNCAGGLIGTASGTTTLSGASVAAAVTGNTSAGGLIGTASGDTTLNGATVTSTVTGKTNAGGLIGTAGEKESKKTTTLQNSISVEGATVEATNGNAGGLVGIVLEGASGDANYHTLSMDDVGEIAVCPNVTATNGDAGGLVGRTSGNTRINTAGTIRATNVNIQADGDCGIIVGEANGPVNVNEVTIQKSGTATNQVYSTGGNAGGLAGKTGSCTVTLNGDCTISVSDLTVKADNGNAGGLAGLVGKKLVINGSAEVEEVTVTGESSAGGLAGNIDSTDSSSMLTTAGGTEVVTVTDATIQATAGNSGGLIGTTSAKAETTLNNVTVTSTNKEKKIQATGGDAGGLVGQTTAGTLKLSNCQVYLVDPKTNEIKQDTPLVNGTAASGGLIGSAEGGTVAIENSLASTNLGTSDTTTSGGLVGANTAAVTASGSYADCYIYGKNTGGLVGSSSGTTTLTSCYAAGYQTAETEAAGLVLGTIASGSNNDYTITCVHVDGNPTVYNTAVGNSSTSNSIYYAVKTVKQDGTEQIAVETDTKDATKTKNLSSKTKSLTGFRNLRAEETENSHRYCLDGKDDAMYDFPVVLNGEETQAVQDHYGDWDAELVELFRSEHLYYFEKYVPDNAENDYHNPNYNRETGEGEITVGVWGAEDYEDIREDPKKTGNTIVYDDGYAILYDEKCTYKFMVEGENKTWTLNASGETPVWTNPDYSPSDILEGNSPWDTDSHFILNTKSGKEFVTLPKAISHLGKLSDSFFYTAHLYVTNAEGKKDDYTIYYNPYFAKTATDNEQEGAPEEIKVRSPRSLYGMGSYYDGWLSVCLDDKTTHTFKQELCLDFSSYLLPSTNITSIAELKEADAYKYKKIGSSDGEEFVLGMKPITELRSNCTYDGGSYTIKDIALKDNSDGLLGLFGENKGTIKNVKIEGCTAKCGRVDLGSSLFGVKNLCAGVLAAKNQGTIQDCSVTLKTTSDAEKGKGLSNCFSCYYVDVGSVSLSTESMTTSGDAVYVGGLVGQNSGELKGSSLTVTGGDGVIQGMTTYAKENYIGLAVGLNTNMISDVHVLTQNGRENLSITKNSTSLFSATYCYVGGLVGKNGTDDTNDTNGKMEYSTLVGSDEQGNYSTLSVTANNGSSFVGGLVGENAGKKASSTDEYAVSNCAVANYNLTVTGNSTATALYVGGFAGQNSSGASIGKCSAVIPTLDCTTEYIKTYNGGFIGLNAGTVSNSYTMSYIEHTNNGSGLLSTNSIAGFIAGSEKGSSSTCYCVSSITTKGSNSTYAFAPKGATESNCYYLKSGKGNSFDFAGNPGLTYTQKDGPGTNIVYNGSNDPIKNLVSKLGKPFTKDSVKIQFSPYTNKNASVAFPYPAVVQDVNKNYIHYGEWPIGK